MVRRYEVHDAQWEKIIPYLGNITNMTGRPRRIIGNCSMVHDGVMLPKCLDQLDISGSTLLTDKSHGSWENREYISNRCADFLIPPKSNAVDSWYCDYAHY